MKKHFEKITCPVCGTEYLPCEIYIPDNFLGKSTDIIKDEDGKILDFYGKEMDLTEKYVCEKCGTLLKINCKLQFYVNEDKVLNFDEEYVSSIHQENLELFEEE